MDLTIWVWCPHCMAGHQIKPADAVLEDEIARPRSARRWPRAEAPRSGPPARNYRLASAELPHVRGRASADPRPRRRYRRNRGVALAPMSHAAGAFIAPPDCCRRHPGRDAAAGARADDKPHCEPAAIGTATRAGGARWPHRRAGRRPRGPARRHRAPQRGDAPPSATAALQALVAGREVGLLRLGPEADRYGRVVGPGLPDRPPRRRRTSSRMRCWRRATPGSRPGSGMRPAPPRFWPPNRRPGRPALAFGRTRIISSRRPRIRRKSWRNGVVSPWSRARCCRCAKAAATIYVNFGRRWSEDFTVTILKRNERRFAAAGLELKKLAGRHVRVRGTVEERGGPWIEATHPEQIEIAGARLRGMTQARTGASDRRTGAARLTRRLARAGAARAAARRLLDARASDRRDSVPAPLPQQAGRAVAGPAARAPAHPRRLWRRLRGRAAAGHARQDRREAGGGVRAAGPEVPGHHPQLARGQRLRAADRPALRHPRPDRARQRQLRARLGAGARDGARDRPPRRDPRGPGAPGRAGQPRRHRSAQRSAARRAGAGQIEDRAGELLARAGVRGRRHRRRHFRARRLRPLWRRALPHLDGAQRPAARAARAASIRARRISCRRIRRRRSASANAVANARQFAGPGSGSRATRPSISR